MKRAAILAALLTLAAPPAYAHIANPTPLEAVQPDGTKVALRLRGDEFYNWKEDLNGFTVLDDRGWLVYAAVDANGDLAPTRFVLGRDDPKAAGLAPNAMPSPARLSQLRAARMAGGYNPSGAARASVPPRGTIKNLVVLCRFSDHTPGVNDHPQADYDVLFNQLGGDATLAPTGSVRDFYTENSFGVMDLQSTVVAWVTLPHTEAWYCNGQQGFGVYPQNAQGMVEAALNLVDPTVDFGQFDSDNDGYIDAIDIIHSGFDAAETGSSSNIWSHKWSLYALPNGHWTSNDRNAHGDFVKVFDYHTESALSGTSGSIIVRLAVICHETGHFFGLPDLYDTDGSSEGDGSWSLMANDWGFDFTGLHPPFFDAWSKQFLGWVAPTPLMASGVYVISQAETNAQAYRIDHWYPNGEYLLIENRQPVSFESDMPQGGLVVLHVDETKGTFAQNDVNNDEGYPGQPGWPQNGRHYRVAVLQADARYDLEHGLNRGDAGDAYFSRAGAAIANGTLPSTDAYQNGNVFNSDNTIADISAPGSAMSFTYQTSVPVVQHTLTLSRTGIGRVRADGILHDLPWAGQFFDGQSVQLNAVPEPGWFFRDWSGDLNGGVTPQTIVMDGDKSVTANFINRRIVHLTLMSTGRGVVKVNGQQVALPWQGQYLSGESIRLEAIANPGWYFLNWSVGLTGSQNPIDFVINNDLTALATFINTPPLTLSLDKTGNGEAKVDGALVTLPWQGLFRPGDTVTLDPAPGVNWYFLNWSGDMNGNSTPGLLKMDSNKNVTLNFVDTRPYTFTIFKTGNGSFLVNGVARQAPWQGGFRFGEVVSILAVPDPGWTFLNWETDLRGSDNPEAVFMDADKTVTGNFTNQPTATLTLNRTGNGQARVNGLTVSLPWTGIFLQGDQVTVQSMAAAGWSFARYTGDLSGNADPQTLTMDTNKTVTLVFLDTPPLTLTLSVAAGLGSATVDGDPVTLPWTGGFRENEIVNIVPVPAPPDPKTWYFLYWLVDHVGNEVPLNLLMDSSKDITLSFGRLNPTIRYVDDDAPNDPGPNDPDISDPLEDGTFAHPFDMIQEALDVVEEGDTVIVLTGYYEENLIYPGLWDGEKYTGYRDVILRSGQTASPFDLDPDNTTIDGGYNGPTVRFFGLENAFSTLQGFTITGGSGELGYGGAIDGNGTLSTVIGNIIDSNDAGLGGAAALCYGPFTNNTFSNNGAATGGALYQCRGPILNNIFEGNGSSGNGGALANCNNRVEGNQFIYNIASTGRYNNNAGGGDQYGGAIYNCNGPNSVFIKNVFESNFAEREGGAIYQCGGNIINNVFDSNVAGDNDGGFPAPWGGRGGALSNCDGEITSNTFTSNIAYPDLLNDQTTNNHPARNQNTGMGGAIYNCGGRIDHNIFDSNYAVYGWTDYQSDADDVHKNPYGGEGGAIHSCPGQIDHNVFTYNLADIQGGALHSCSGEINNNMIVDNVAIGQDYVDNNGNTHVYAPSGGGAIYNCNGGSIVNCTIYNNYAGYNCGGIEASDSSIRNCILWENGFTNSPLRNSSTPTYSIIQHWTGGGAGNLIADPQVVDAANGDYHLTPGSPAIDAGSAVTGETDDYEGDFRPNLVLPTPKGDGSGIDIGADEFYLGYPWVPPGEGPPYQLSIKRSGLGKVRINGEYISMPYSQRIYRQGEVVHIEAIPGDNYFFFAWKGTLWTAANPLDLTMDGDKALTVVFITGETPYRLSLDMAGAGTGKVLVNGVLVDLPWQGLLNNAYKNVTLQAVPDPGFFFMNWSGDLTGNLNPTNIVVDQDRHVTVSFSNTQPYNLYITRSGQGVVWVNGALVQLPWAGAFLPFSSVTLQAGPSLGWYFSNWSGQVSSGSNPYTLIMDNNKGVIANFVNATPYLLTLDRTGQGSVKVNGNQVTPPWTGRFLENQVVTLEPVPDPFWHFLNYTGDVIGSAVPEHLAMDGDKNVTLNFVDVEPFIVDVFKAGTGSGSLKVNGQETSLPWQGKYPSDQATSITLEAVPNPGSYFMNWSGDLSGSFNPDQLRVDSDKQVTATFSNQEPATLYATGSGNGHILVDGVAQTLPFQGNFAIGSVVTVEAAPDPFWFFFGWSGDSYGSANPTTILMDTDKAITATFAPTSPYSLNLWKNGAGRAKVNGRLVDLPWQGNFNTSDTVTLEAVPDPNINFIKWSGDLTGNASPAVMVMGAQSKNIWVNFSDRPPVALTVTGNGQGQVSVEGVLRLLPWTEFYAEGDVAQLAASPMPGWGFLKWWGDLVGNQTPVGLLMDEDKDVTAIFIPFSDLDYSTAFLGMTINEHSGLSVAGAGDVNGDGYADLLIGAPDNSEGGKSAGKVYLVLGRPDQNFQHVNALAAVADASFLGAAAGDRAGGSIVSAGDVNGDGYADFLVGAPGNDANSKSNSGKAYLLLGTANPSAAWGLNAKMETVANASFAGEFQNDNAGFAVGGATNGVGLDVNGDGLNDFLIGAYGNDEGGGTLGNATTGAGKTYLLLGRSSANWGKNFALANAEASFLGEGPYDFAGYAVSGVGDANGDGFGDFIIGAYNNDDMGGDSSQFSGAGKAYLLLGAADPAAKWGKSFKLGYSPLNPAQGADAFFYAMVAFDGVDFGRTLAGVGDSNHDGYMDFIVGGPAANYPYGTARGQADLVLGRAVWNKAYSTGTDVLYMGEGFADQFGWAAAGGAGNINGDNYDDVIVGAPRYNYPWTDLVGGFHNEQQAGRVYIDPPPFQPATGAYGPPGERAFDMLGTSCAGLGDFNGDGIDDYVVGAPMNDDGGQEMGKTYVLYGLITTPSASSMRQTVAGAAPAVDFATARARIKYQSGSKSVDTMTIQRSKSSIAGLGDGKVGAVADVCWRLETTRQGFTGQVTFHYTQTEIRGMNESAMRLYQAPGPAGPWALVTGQTVDVNRNLVKGTITSGGWFALSVGSPQGPPTLGAVSDNGGGLLKLTWSQAVQTPAQVLAFAWDIYLANWSDKGVGGSMWFLFAGGAKSGSLALDQSGGYHAWVSNQYYDGGWRPCGNPWTGILYSGKPHTPVGLSVEDRGGGTMRLHWKPEWYGTWHDQIIVYKDGAGWVPTQGPSGTQLWHFVDFGYLGFGVGTADFFAGWGDFHLSPGTYYFYIRGVGWDGVSIGDFAVVGVTVP